MIEELPWALLEVILSYAASNPAELCRMERVCQTWCLLVRDSEQDEGEQGALFAATASSWWASLPSTKKMGMGERLGRRQHSREACCRLYRQVVVGELMTSFGVTRQSLRGRVEALDDVIDYIQAGKSKRAMVATVRATLPVLKNTDLELSRKRSLGEEDEEEDELKVDLTGVWILERIKSSLKKSLVGAW